MRAHHFFESEVCACDEELVGNGCWGVRRPEVIDDVSIISSGEFEATR